MYDVSEIDILDPVGELEPGTSILVSGPPMTGKRRLVFRILAEGGRKQENSIVVTSDRNADSVLDEYRKYHDDVDRVGVVDCSGSKAPDQSDTDKVSYVSSPSDLTGISIHVSEFMEEFRQNDIKLRVAVISVSTLLMYLDIETVFRFLHVFTSRIQNVGALGVFVIDSTSIEYQTLSTIKQPFDGVVEFRDNDDGPPELRVTGITPQPTEWKKAD